MIVGENNLDEQAHDKRIEILKSRINDEDYIHAAVQRLALILSNELLEITMLQEGDKNGWKRQRRK